MFRFASALLGHGLPTTEKITSVVKLLVVDLEVCVVGIVFRKVFPVAINSVLLLIYLLSDSGTVVI